MSASHCDAAAPEAPSPPPPRVTRRIALRWAMFGALALLIFTGVLAAATYAGVYYGERDRLIMRQEALDAHYHAGLVALNEGRYELAIAEFGYVRQLDPQHALAAQGAAEARTRLEIRPTPTSEVTESLAEQLLEQARATYSAEDWPATARTLTQLRALDLTYAREEVETLLFTSLYHAGIVALDEDFLEVGISYLDQAIALRPLDVEAVNRRNLAARYMDALNYWGVDWELCIRGFEALHATNPQYKDVARRLYNAYRAYADYWSGKGETCPAERYYTQALRLFSDPGVDQKRAEAAQVCLLATPAPLSGDAPALTPQPIQGFSMGRLAYPVYNQERATYDLYALYADGRILRVAQGADQPWWERGTWRVVYRDRLAGDVKLVLPEEGIPLPLTAPLRQAWPTLSPDSQRLAYAAPDEAGIWSIYVLSLTAPSEVRKLAPGWAPAWGPSGHLAYTGCDGAGNCGIMVNHPDDGQPATRLTGSQSDKAVSWSPGGELIAYMTNVTGNWDIFLLNMQGGVQQLTTHSADDGLPTWSPDGSHIAFISNRSGGWGVYVMPLGQETAWRILDLGASLPGWDNQRLSWSP